MYNEYHDVFVSVPKNMPQTIPTDRQKVTYGMFIIIVGLSTNWTGCLSIDPYHAK